MKVKISLILAAVQTTQLNQRSLPSRCYENTRLLSGLMMTNITQAITQLTDKMASPDNMSTHNRQRRSWRLNALEVVRIICHRRKRRNLICQHLFCYINIIMVFYFILYKRFVRHAVCWSK